MWKMIHEWSFFDHMLWICLHGGHAARHPQILWGCLNRHGKCSSLRRAKIITMICKKPSLFIRACMLVPIMILLLIQVIMQPVSASVFFLNGTEVIEDQIHNLNTNTSGVKPASPVQLDFFYDNSCQSCQGALNHVRFFQKRNPNIPITYYDLGYSKENNILFTQYKTRFNTTKIRYPTVFIGDIVISGSSDIIHNLEPLTKGTWKWFFSDNQGTLLDFMKSEYYMGIAKYPCHQNL